jgi:hypothetical protein
VANHENLKNMSDKQFLTVNEVARIYNKSVQTVYRNIKAGKLSRLDSGLIALSECLRAYGAMPNQAINTVIPENNNMANSANLDVIALLQDKINSLETAVTELKGENKELKLDAKELRAEFLARENRLLAILENKAGSVVPGADRTGGGLFGKWFK